MNNNVSHPHWAIYIGLLMILLILIGLVSIIPMSGSKKTKITVSPTLIKNNFSEPEIKISSRPTPKNSLVAPTNTGAMEEIPKNIADIATQKLELKKKVPIKTEAFSIEFKYETDKFIVLISSPTDKNKVEFDNWLKTNYSLIPFSSFEFIK